MCRAVVLVVIDRSWLTLTLLFVIDRQAIPTWPGHLNRTHHISHGT
jgi:hypothetical protein